MKAVIRPAEEADIAIIAADIRPADAVEMAALGTTPADAMREGMRLSSWAATGLLDGVPVCMFGVSPQNLILGHGVPWMLSARGVERAQIAFLRRCRPAVEVMRAQYPTLRNVVHVENRLAIRWLAWLGFLFRCDPVSGERERYLIGDNEFFIFGTG